MSRSGGQHGRIGTAAIGASALLVLTACAHREAYAPPPGPLAVAAFPPAMDARRLDEKPLSGVWSQADLLKAALARSPAVAQARATYAAALAQARTATVRPAASISLTGEYSTEAGLSSPWLFGVGSDIPLDRAALRNERIANADLLTLQALYDYGEAVWAVRNAVAHARAEWLAADHEAPAAEQVLAVRHERTALMERRVAAGEDARAGALSARADELAAERALRDIQGRRDIAVAALAGALTLPPAAVQQLRLAPSDAEPQLSALPAWRNEAALSRRDVLRAVADYDLAESALRLEVAKQAPEIHIGPGYTWEHGASKLPFTLTLVLPPSDRNRAAIDGAEARRARAGRALEKVQADILSGVDQAAAELRVAQGVGRQIRQDDLPLARKVLVSNTALVRGGEADRGDELTARTGEAQAELASRQADGAVALRLADLEDALRRSFDPAEMAVLQKEIAQVGEGR